MRDPPALFQSFGRVRPSCAKAPEGKEIKRKKPNPFTFDIGKEKGEFWVIVNTRTFAFVFPEINSGQALNLVQDLFCLPELVSGSPF